MDIRYQYDMNAPGSPSQLRITSTRDLNLNVSVSNTNMLSQAYASWNNISLGDELFKKVYLFFSFSLSIKKIPLLQSESGSASTH
jgi:hypothetical protein